MVDQNTEQLSKCGQAGGPNQSADNWNHVNKARPRPADPRAETEHDFENDRINNDGRERSYKKFDGVTADEKRSPGNSGQANVHRLKDCIVLREHEVAEESEQHEGEEEHDTRIKDGADHRGPKVGKRTRIPRQCGEDLADASRTNAGGNEACIVTRDALALPIERLGQREPGMEIGGDLGRHLLKSPSSHLPRQGRKTLVERQSRPGHAGDFLVERDQIVGGHCTGLKLPRCGSVLPRAQDTVDFLGSGVPIRDSLFGGRPDCSASRLIYRRLQRLGVRAGENGLAQRRRQRQKLGQQQPSVIARPAATFTRAGKHRQRRVGGIRCNAGAPAADSRSL